LTKALKEVERVPQPRKVRGYCHNRLAQRHCAVYNLVRIGNPGPLLHGNRATNHLGQPELDQNHFFAPLNRARRTSNSTTVSSQPFPQTAGSARSASTSRSSSRWMTRAARSSSSESNTIARGRIGAPAIGRV